MAKIPRVDCTRPLVTREKSGKSFNEDDLRDDFDDDPSEVELDLATAHELESMLSQMKDFLASQLAKKAPKSDKDDQAKKKKSNRWMDDSF